MPTASTKLSTALTRQTINAARVRYERGETVVAIAAALKIGESTIWRYKTNESWARPGTPEQAAKVSVEVAVKEKLPTRRSQPRRADAPDESAGRSGAASAPSKKKVGGAAVRKATRLPRQNLSPESEENSCAADDTAPAFDSGRQSALVNRIWRVVEKQVAEIERRIGASEAGAGERDARALAVMTRMLRELAALKGSTQRDAEHASTAEDDDDEFDREVDEYCAKVTRILESMRERRDESAPADPGNAAADDRADGDELAASGQGGSVSA